MQHCIIATKPETVGHRPEDVFDRYALDNIKMPIEE